MNTIYKKIFTKWLSKNDELPFDIKGLDDTGKMDVDINPSFLKFFNKKIKKYPDVNQDIEGFFKELILLYAKD